MQETVPPRSSQPFAAWVCSRGRRRQRRTPDRRRVVGHLAHRPRRRPGLREARAGEAARGGGLAGAGRAQPLRGALDAARQRRRARFGAAAARARTKPPARWRCSSCRPTATRCGRRNCATATPTRRLPRRSRSTLARIHAATAADPSVAGRISHRPRSSTTSGWSPIWSRPPARIPISRRRLHALVAATQANKRALVHGDVSPKNILRGPDGPVFLDAECAWWGDPAFDLAFCLNHLLLKCLWTPAAAAGFLACFDALAAAYLARRRLGAAATRWKPRAARLLPGLFLAQGGWQVAGRVHHRRAGQGPGAARRARAARRTRSMPRRCAPGLDEGAVRMTDTAIAFVHGRRVWDSRGRPTVEAEVLLEGGGGRPRHRAGRRVHRHRRGARPARRRRGVRRLRRDARGRPRERRDRPRGHRHGRRRPGRARPPADRTGRHAEQVAARRQRGARGVDGRRARRRGRRGRAAVSLSRRRRREHAAAAADPDFRRRRACRAARRYPGFHGRLPRRRELRPGAGLDGRGVPRRRRADAGGRHAGRRRRRGRLVAGLRHQRAGDGDAGPRDRARRLRARRARSPSRSTSPPRSSAAAASTSWRWRTRSWTATA